ncbi:MAG: N-acyl-D-amino-acid deacylase family protein [Bacteroidota bacterium]
MSSILIRNGRIVDGSGNPWFRGDVAVENGIITSVESRLPAEGFDVIIEADGKMVAPGFVDIHSHSDFVLPLKRHQSLLEPLLRQGVTTIITGNCGFSPAPVSQEYLDLAKSSTAWMCAEDLAWNWRTYAEFLNRLRANGLAVNVGQLSSHGSIRIAVMGMSSRQPSGEEMSRMLQMLEEDLEAGAIGLSLGLGYPPGMYSKTEELLEFGKVLAGHPGRPMVFHLRGLCETFTSAVKEAIKIGGKLGIPIHCSHFVAVGPENWHRVDEGIAMVEEARRSGVDITYDMYPYVAGNTTLTALYPPEALDGGTEALLAKLRDPAQRAKVREDIEDIVPGWPSWLPGAWSDNFVRSFRPENILVTWVPGAANKRFEGKSLSEVGELLGGDWFDALVKLTLDEHGEAMILVVGAGGNLEDETHLRRILTRPYASIATDAVLIGRGKANPAGFGAFARVLGKYAREEKLFSMEEAVRKMTSLSLQRYGVRDRGLIRTGMKADIVVFDPEQITDRATLTEPEQFAEGVEYVLVNGRVVVERGSMKECLPGELLLGRS